MQHTAPRNNFTVMSQLAAPVQRARALVDDDEAFWIGDFNRPRECLELWDANLPSVKMFYATKCCDEPNLLRFLAERDVGFDCASKDELRRILALGVDPSRIVFSHPLKSIDALRYAKEHDVDKLVFDSAQELRKIVKYYCGAEVFLRVKPKFSNARIRLSDKFGADSDDVGQLLRLAKDIGANLIGFSFHVGSQCDDPETMRAAIQYASELKTTAEAIGFTVSFLDIGGGFYSPNTAAKVGFAEIAAVIENALEQFFGDEDIEVIAEPGRFVAAEYLSLNLPVIGAKEHEDSDGNLIQNIYIPDGIYGAFSCIPYDHAEPHFDIVTSDKGEKLIRTNLWGQTCDSMDLIYRKMMWPRLEVGDFMTVRKFGAYTYSPTSFFNGFQHHKVITVNEDDDNENTL